LINSKTKRKNPVIVLLPPTDNRLKALHDVLNGKERAERYLFYGLEYLIQQGVNCTHNLQVKPDSKIQTLISCVHRKIFSVCFIYYGEIEWILPVFKSLFSSSLMLVFSERTMLAMIYWRIICLLPHRPTVMIPIGLSEKLAVMRKKRSFFYRLCIKELKKIDLIIPLSQKVARILIQEYGLRHNVRFIPAGVDSDYFSPKANSQMSCVDVLSIGADPFRDFNTLFNAANELPAYSFRIITRKIISDTFKSIPSNIEVIADIPMELIRDYLKACTLVALPVHDNNYSGATTVLLQAMAMGKPVIANRIGANIGGYGLQHGKNVMFVPPGESLLLRNKIKMLIQNPDICESIGKSARKTVIKNLSIEQFNKKLYKILDDLSLRNYGKKMNQW
jgi:glycosyltransferase involved in cell wall biosynthesis